MAFASTSEATLAAAARRASLSSVVSPRFLGMPSRPDSLSQVADCPDQSAAMLSIRSQSRCAASATMSSPMSDSCTRRNEARIEDGVASAHLVFPASETMECRRRAFDKAASIESVGAERNACG